MPRRKDSGASAAHPHDSAGRPVDDAGRPVDDSGDRTAERPADTDRHPGPTEAAPDRRSAGASLSGTPLAHRGHVEARDRFGGINWGSGFFGWLVAIGLAMLLVGVVGALAAAIGSSLRISQSAAEREAGTIGVALMGIVFVIYGTALCWGVRDNVIPSLGVSRALAYIPLPVSGLLMTVFALQRFWSGAPDEVVEVPREELA